MAKKCGICQQNKIENKIQPPELRLLVAALQPPNTGNAPGIEPINVLRVLNLLLGVYINKYKNIVKKQIIAVKSLIF